MDTDQNYPTPQAQKLALLLQQLKVKQLEKSRRHRINMRVLHFSMSAIIGFLILFGLRNPQALLVYAVMAVIGAVLWRNIATSAVKNFKNQLQSDFKQLMIAEIMAHTYPDVEYIKVNPIHGKTLVSAVKRANLLKQVGDIHAADRFEYNQGQMDWAFLEVDIFEAHEQYTDPEYYNNQPIFSGLLFNWRLPSRLCPEQVIIIPQPIHSSLDKTNAYKKFTTNYLLDFENEGFIDISQSFKYKLFNPNLRIFSKSPDAAEQRIFTTQFLQKISHWYDFKRYNCPVFFSFFDNKIQALVLSSGEWFEPIWEQENINQDKSIEKIYAHLSVCCDFAMEIGAL